MKLAFQGCLALASRAPCHRALGSGTVKQKPHPVHVDLDSLATLNVILCTHSLASLSSVHTPQGARELRTAHDVRVFMDVHNHP